MDNLSSLSTLFLSNIFYEKIGRDKNLKFENFTETKNIFNPFIFLVKDKQR